MYLILPFFFLQAVDLRIYGHSRQQLMNFTRYSKIFISSSVHFASRYQGY